MAPFVYKAYTSNYVVMMNKQQQQTRFQVLTPAQPTQAGIELIQEITLSSLPLWLPLFIFSIYETKDKKMYFSFVNLKKTFKVSKMN